MKILRYPESCKAEIVEVPTPEPTGNLILSKSLYCNISAGTEMGFYRGTAPQMNYEIEPGWFFKEKPGNIKFPMQSDGEGVWWMGYANVSEVLETGPDVTKFRPGDIIFSQVGHKSHQIIPESAAIKLPPGTNPEHAALTALVEIAFNGILDAGIRLMDWVAVFGLGTLGQLLVQMSKLSSAKVIAVDGLKKRMNLATKGGADFIVDFTKKDPGQKIYELTKDRGADVVFEVSGNVKALSDAIRAAAYNGKVTVLSFYQDPAASLKLGNEYHHKRIKLQCSQILGIHPPLSNTWGMERRREAALELVNILDIESLISHRFDFEQAPEAFQLIDKKPEECNAIILKY